MHQPSARPEDLFGHIFDEEAGFLVSFTGRQARLGRADARRGTRRNELAEIRQRSWPYPARASAAAADLLAESRRGRDAYIGVHLFREGRTRRAANALSTVRALWLDEDEGRFPEEGPEPTAIVHSSATRRHLYWRLTQPVAVESAVAMNRRIAVWAKGDISKASAASVLRVPGTANFKRHPRVDRVVMELTGAGHWDPEVIEQAIPEILETPRRRQAEPYDGPAVDLTPYLERVEFLGEVPDSLGVKYQIVCPWLRQHTGGDRSGTYIGQRDGGGCWFACNHQHCERRTWREFKRAVFRRTPRSSPRRFTIGQDRPDYSGPGVTVEVHYE